MTWEDDDFLDRFNHSQQLITVKIKGLLNEQVGNEITDIRDYLDYIKKCSRVYLDEETVSVELLSKESDMARMKNRGARVTFDLPGEVDSEDVALYISEALDSYGEMANISGNPLSKGLAVRKVVYDGESYEFEED